MFKKERWVIFSFVLLFTLANAQTQNGGVGFWGELSVRFYCTIAVITDIDENSMCTSDTFLRSISGTPTTTNRQQLSNNGSTTVINNYIVSSTTPQTGGGQVVYIPGPQGPQGPAGQTIIVTQPATSTTSLVNSNGSLILSGATSFPFTGASQFNGFGVSNIAGPAGKDGVSVVNVSTTSNSFSIVLNDGKTYTVDFPATSTTLFATSSNIVFSTTTNFFASSSVFNTSSGTNLITQNSTVTFATSSVIFSTTSNFINSFTNFFVAGDSTTSNSTSTNNGK